MKTNKQLKEELNESQADIAKVHAAFEENRVGVIPHHHHEQECRELLIESFDNLARVKMLLDEMDGTDKDFEQTTKAIKFK